MQYSMYRTDQIIQAEAVTAIKIQRSALVFSTTSLHLQLYCLYIFKYNNACCLSYVDSIVT